MSGDHNQQPCVIEVVSAAVVMAGRVLMIQRMPKPGWPMLDYVFATPGGKVEPGETHGMALVRELGEELGLQVTRVGSVVYSVVVEPPLVAAPVRVTCYRIDASDTVGMPRALDGVVGFAWFHGPGLTALELAPADAMGLRELQAALKAGT
jgi:8-oxo-dGTP pyrophosphatase MutT (NUDIX family)